MTVAERKLAIEVGGSSAEAFLYTPEGAGPWPGVLFLTDLIAFFEMRPAIASKPNALPAPRPITRGFEFRNVSFRYPGSPRLVLDGLNRHFHAGQR